MRELGIEYIPAGSPQAKGRVERSFQTDQDRLVKELRRRGIRSIEAANAYLEAQYVPMLNRRFAVPAASTVDAHRPIQGYDLGAILSVQTVRTAANDYTARHGGRRYQIRRASIGGGLRGSKVIIEERRDGRRRRRFRGRYLALDDVPSAKAPRRPAPDHPWRQPFKKKRPFLLCPKEDIASLR